jgi:osmoprotectant transport system ATP-binding protein
MIELEKVGKSYDGGSSFVVRDLSVRIEQGETVVLLGASGCGKTTTLRMINRLTDLTEGRILIDGQDIMAQDPIELRRSIGYAIQSIGLFPHMSIAENIAVVPKMLGWDKKAINDRIDHLLSMVSLDPEEFRDRHPNQLSGGQKQRVGVARALAADPPIVLMDEPFGALDPITREQLQNEFLELESEIQKTIVFVTHDIFEAVRMGDRIALLNEGSLEQLASPAELVEKPAGEFVEAFLGQHRFQLSLTTRTLRTILEIPPDAPRQEGPLPAKRLTVRTTFVDALDKFHETNAKELPVYQGRKKVGVLAREDLTRRIARTLETGGQVQS